jgi:hypothetical protein
VQAEQALFLPSIRDPTTVSVSIAHKETLLLDMSQNRVGLTFEALIHENKKRPNNRLQVRSLRFLGPGGNIERWLRVRVQTAVTLASLSCSMFKTKYTNRTLNLRMKPV